jgi:hypothetical protein
MPPTAGPQCEASAQVDSPRTLASGAMASADAIKIASGDACMRSSAMAAGRKSRSRFSQRWLVRRGNLLHRVLGIKREL